ncbi:MAG TPA: hypothetical protein VFV08_06215, partial [Puia sp.]|nr:hypothetical protein [Puia sp.]
MDKAQVRNRVNYANVGEAIDHELAAKMVKDFQDTFNDATAGFVIGKAIIEKILSQPGCVAI